jgi:hypothetical protein
MPKGGIKLVSRIDQDRGAANPAANESDPCALSRDHRRVRIVAFQVGEGSPFRH